MILSGKIVSILKYPWTKLNQSLSSKGRGGGGSFATFTYSVIPELSCHLRPMVRKSKSLLFGLTSRIFKKRYLYNFSLLLYL